MNEILTSRRWTFAKLRVARKLCQNINRNMLILCLNICFYDCCLGSSGGKEVGHITVKSIGGRQAALRASDTVAHLVEDRAGVAGATGLHAIVFLTMVASLAVMMLCYFALFWQVPETLFMLVVSFGFMVVYVCVPMMMLRFEFTARQSIGSFIHRPLIVGTGAITGGNAWQQICLIPVMLAFAAICLCIVITFIRP